MPGTNMNSPRVSVVMAAYNAGDYIARAIDSALQQDDVSLEVIVVDDCSADSTVEIVEEIITRDARVKLFKNEVNSGPSCSRNRAISEASGEWVAVLDADDEFRPERLARLLHLSDETNAEMICDYLQPVDEHGSIVNGLKMYPIVKPGKWMYFTSADFLLADMPGGNGLKAGYLKPMIRRDVLEKNFISYNDSVRVGEDALLFFECLVKGVKAVVTPESYYYYRLTTNSLCRQVSNDNIATLRDVNQKMINMASRYSRQNLTDLLYHRDSLYDCACRYQLFVRAIKSASFMEAVRVVRFNTQCLSYFIKTFKQRLMLRIKMTGSR